MWLRIPHAVHHVNENVSVKPRAFMHRNRSSHALNAALGVRKRALFFGVTAAWQHHVGHLRRFCHEQLLHNQKIKRFQGFHHVRNVGVGAHWVFSHDVHRLQRTIKCAVELVGCVMAHRTIQRHAPRILELLEHARRCELLIAGEVVGVGAHIACALHVILPAQGVHAAAGTPNFACCHGQIRQRKHASGSRSVLGDAQAIQNGCGVRASIHQCSFNKHALVNATNFGNTFRRIRSNYTLQFVKIFGALGNKFFVNQIMLNKNVRHSVEQCNVCPRSQLQMNVGARG